MLGKLLLTIAIVVLAFYALRQRYVGPEQSGAQPADGRAARGRSRHRLIQVAAALVIVVMVLGSALTLLQGWERRRDVVTVEVANPITGTVEHFEARRSDVADQTIVTLDGRRIRVSEVERIIIRDAP